MYVRSTVPNRRTREDPLETFKMGQAFVASSQSQGEPSKALHYQGQPSKALHYHGQPAGLRWPASAGSCYYNDLQLHLLSGRDANPIPKVAVILSVLRPPLCFAVCGPLLGGLVAVVGCAGRRLAKNARFRADCPKPPRPVGAGWFS